MRLELVLFAVMAAGCSPVAPTSMEQVQFPEGFALDTSRGVALSVVAAAGADVTRSVTVRVPGGGVVFEGPASYLVDHGLRVRAQHDVSSLEIVSDGSTELVALDARGAGTYTLTP